MQYLTSNQIFYTLNSTDLIFVEFQQASQQDTFFKTEERNNLLAPVNTKWLLLKFKFLTELQQEPPKKTAHLYYNVSFCSSLKITTFP